MARFIVRYRGNGARPEDTVNKLRSIKGAAVVDDAGRMMLMDVPEQALRSVLASEPDWLIAPEVAYPMPDTRKRAEGLSSGT